MHLPRRKQRFLYWVTGERVAMSVYLFFFSGPISEVALDIVQASKPSILITSLAKCRVKLSSFKVPRQEKNLILVFVEPHYVISQARMMLHLLQLGEEGITP